jgi:hypothetical protein
MEAFDELIEEFRSYYGNEVADYLDTELRHIAQKMDRFPLGEWMDTNRGCGCVVGEYLVRNGKINRGDWEIEDALGCITYGRYLDRFGVKIDSALSDRVRMGIGDDTYQELRFDLDDVVIVFHD